MKIVICFFITLFIFVGCLATSEEITSLKRRLEKLNSEIKNLKNSLKDYRELLLKSRSESDKKIEEGLKVIFKSQADILTEINNLRKEFMIISEKLDENRNKVRNLAERLDDMRISFLKKIDTFYEGLSSSSLPIISPSELFRLAYIDYSKGNYDLAIIGFKSFIDKHPSTELASQAQYYLSDIYFVKKDWEKALKGFDVLIKNYPKSDFIPSAMLKKAIALIALNNLNDAKLTLEKLIKDFPNSPEAKQANEKLKLLQEK